MSMKEPITKDNYDQILQKVEAKEHSLKTEDQILVNQEVDNRAKSLTAIWVIWLCFGLWGGHRFYMHRKYAAIMLALTLVGYLTCIFFVGFIFLLATVIWKIIDACHLCRWIKIQRLSIRREIVYKLK